MTGRAWTMVLLLALSPRGVAAQQAPAIALDGTQLTGMRLFNQSCRVCHTKPQLTSPNYGPELSKETLGGQGDVVREIIGNGTPRMPGFKYHFTPAQIDAIVAYLKTVPSRQASSASSGTSRASSRDAD
jgi:mono/diheme cytochrome c family protein